MRCTSRTTNRTTTKKTIASTATGVHESTVCPMSMARLDCSDLKMASGLAHGWGRIDKTPAPRFAPGAAHCRGEAG